MRQTQPEHFLFTISELSRMLGFDRRTIETRLYTNRVFRHKEEKGVPLYVLKEAAEAVYCTEFSKGAACPSKSIS